MAETNKWERLTHDEFECDEAGCTNVARWKRYPSPCPYCGHVICSCGLAINYLCDEHVDIKVLIAEVEGLRAERDEARQWARDLLVRCELEHWLQMRMADWTRADVDAAVKERDILRAEQWLPCTDDIPMGKQFKVWSREGGFDIAYRTTIDGIACWYCVATHDRLPNNPTHYQVLTPPKDG